MKIREEELTLPDIKTYHKDRVIKNSVALLQDQENRPM